MEKTKNTPKILIVIGYLQIGGGAEKVAAALGNYLTDQGYETHLLTFYETDSKYPYRGIYHSCNERVKTNRLAKIPQIPLRIWRIYRYAKRHKIDVAYSFLEEANFYTLLAKLCGMPTLPVIVSVRNNIKQRGRLFNTMARWLYPKALSVVAVTRAVEQILQNELGLSNTSAIYNPLDLAQIETGKNELLADEHQWIKGAEPLLISIGRLTHQKGQWHLVRAFSRVVEKYPQAKLVILGEGEYRQKIQQLLQGCGLENKVFLFGNHPNVYQFLNHADLFVFSSLYEGMPNTVLEALSVGLPIVSTDCVSGPREILAPELSVDSTIDYPYHTSYGTLTAPLDFDYIASNIHEVALSPAEENLAQAIEFHLEQNFLKGAGYTAYQDRVRDFEYRKIMQEWEKLLPTLNN